MHVYIYVYIHTLVYIYILLYTPMYVIVYQISAFPSAVYHYQFRIQFVNQMERLQPSLTISLTGTKEESGDIPISM